MVAATSRIGQSERAENDEGEEGMKRSEAGDPGEAGAAGADGEAESTLDAKEGTPRASSLPPPRPNGDEGGIGERWRSSRLLGERRNVSKLRSVRESFKLSWADMETDDPPAAAATAALRLPFRSSSDANGTPEVILISSSG